jgi:peptidoglycan/xylan/chitin deacetylase (PgdA/CDA1 family)
VAPATLTRQELYGNRAEVGLPPNFKWPGDRPIAVLVGACFEAWSEGKWPGLSPMGNPLPAGLPDINAMRYAEYGGRRGMSRILRVLKNRSAQATVFINAAAAERYPAVARATADAGHDIAAHSVAQDIIPVVLDELAEQDNIAQSIEALKRICGVAPSGWASPRGTPSIRSERLLAQAGLQWHADTLDDDLPYLIQLGNQSIMAIPCAMEVNDLPLHAKHGHPPFQMVRVFNDALQSLRALGETGKIEVIIHAHVFGRPAGIWAFDEIIRIAQSNPDVWLTNWSEVANYARNSITKTEKQGEGECTPGTYSRRASPV